MSKPVLQTISPFDASDGTTVSFTWSGSRISANTLYVYNNTTNALTYVNTVTDEYAAVMNEIEAERLTNGLTYYAVLIITDTTYNAYTSDKVLFRCYETPTFEFENLPDTIEGQSYTATINYESDDGETFNFCNFYLYDYDTSVDAEDSKTLIKSSEVSMENGTITYTYRGLENHNYYWMRAYGATVHGMELDTGYEEVYVDFANEDVYAPVYAENDSDKGCIHVYTNIVIIESDRDYDEYTYIDEMYIDLQADSVVYSSFDPFDDFTMRIIGYNLWQTQTLLIASNGTDTFELSSRIYNDGYLRFRLLSPVESDTNRYMIYSAPCAFSNDDMITIFLRRINNIFQITVLDYEVEET